MEIKDSGQRREFETGAEMKKEVWRDVVGYEGLYQVSSIGRVRSLDRMTFNGVTNYIKKRQSTKAETR